MRRETEERNLPLIVGELIRRMSDDERMELSRHLSWGELEEWKATAEVLADEKFTRNIRKGLKDEKEGRIRSAEGILRR